LQEHQKTIQKNTNQKHLGQRLEVMVEGKNEARKQWIGRTSQNKTLNFTAPENTNIASGIYVPVQVTTALPNSLVGELAM